MFRGCEPQGARSLPIAPAVVIENYAVTLCSKWTAAQAVAALALALAGACDNKKPPAPVATTTAAAEKESAAPSSTIVAYPLGYTPPADAGAEGGPPLRTGLCSYTDNGYDGQDSKYTERMVIKIKDDVIVGAEYRYRGSYATDGKSESLHVPLVPKKWLEFELPMTSGTKTFKVRFRPSEDMDFKPMFDADAAGECMWEKVEEAEPADASDKKKKKGAHGKR